MRKITSLLSLLFMMMGGVNLWAQLPQGLELTTNQETPIFTSSSLSERTAIQPFICVTTVTMPTLRVSLLLKPQDQIVIGTLWRVQRITQ